MPPAEAFAMMILFLSGATMIILRGPLGKALAERISGKGSAAEAGTVEEIRRLQRELDEMKHRLDEAEERLDFTERLLAQQRQQAAIRPGG
jgi:hypothetical protein